jgi:peptidoglycan/LPS O-acetylase OafA/YrhL
MGAGQSKERLVLLDGMRGIAAFAVIVDHVPSEPLRQLLSGRHLAVDFFFVLSGLVLAMAYSDMVKDRAGVARFFKLRIIRLYPLYLLGLIIGMAVTLAFALRGWGEVEPGSFLPSAISGVLFLPSPSTLGAVPPNDALFPFDGPAWSLFFELVANAAWAIGAWLVGARLRLGFLAICAVWVGVSVFHADLLGAGWLWSDFDVGLSRVLFSFFCGVAIHDLLAWRRIGKVPVLLPLALFLFILAFPAPDTYRRGFDVFATLVLIPVTVYLAAQASIWRVADGACRWLGQVSYGVYILHVPLFMGAGVVLAKLGTGQTLNVVFMAVFAALVTQAATVFYEVPLQRWLKKTFVRSRDGALRQHVQRP